jgi:hypothetical protein
MAELDPKQTSRIVATALVTVASGDQNNAQFRRGILWSLAR